MLRLQTVLVLWTVMGAVAGYTSARMYKLFKVGNLKLVVAKHWRACNSSLQEKGSFLTHVGAVCGLSSGTFYTQAYNRNSTHSFPSIMHFPLCFCVQSVNWKMTTIRTALVFPGVVFSVFFLMNVVLWSQRSSAAVSFTGLLALLALWFGISIPLVFAVRMHLERVKLIKLGYCRSISNCIFGETTPTHFAACKAKNWIRTQRISF